MEINEIIENVALALRGGYPACDVYADDVLQELSPPCFQILTLNGSFEPFPNGRRLRRLPLDIIYYPAAPENNTEMLGIADGLFPLLELISCECPDGGDVLHGTEMRFEIVDGVLHFFVNYDRMLRRETYSELMQSLTGIVGTKTPSAPGGDPDDPGTGSGSNAAGGTGIATGGTEYMQTIDINTNTGEATDNA